MSMKDSILPQVNSPDAELCWALLERVAASPHLRRAARLRELLLYVGQRSLKDGCDHLPEQEIGVNVFGRPDAYDNANDNIVRTNISDLRKRIEAYFVTEGQNEPLVMEIPRGSYLPVFRHRPSQADSPAPPAVIPHSIHPVGSVPALEQGAAVEHPHASRHVSRWIASIAIIALAAVCVAWWMQNRATQRTLQPWKYEPAVASLWSGFLGGSRGTDVVMEDSSFLLIQDMGKRNISLSDYLNKTYPAVAADRSLDPAVQDAQRRISYKILGRASDFRLAQNIRALDPLSTQLHFYNAREYMPGRLQKNNVILLGNPTSNPWYQLFEDQLNFTEVSDTRYVSSITNRHPAAGESAIYTTNIPTVAYCAVAYLPKPDHTGNILLIQGATSEATEAGGDFLLSEDDLSDFMNRLHMTRLPYFELVLKTSHVRGTALTATIEAYRTYPGLH